MPEKPDIIDWSLTTWEGSRREQIRRWSELTLDEILQAQEEMADLAKHFSASPLREDPPQTVRNCPERKAGLGENHR